MRKIITLINSDLRQIFRDKTLTVFLFAPLNLILFARLFIPYITKNYPIIQKYHPMIMMFAGIQTSIMFGFIISFIILDEKDENVLQVIRVLPISPFYFILYRLLFATAFSTFGAFLMINLSGIAYPGFANSILLSIQYGLTAPLITLVIATFAKNKVEGMAYFKGLDLILLLPLVSFLITGSIKHIFVIIPTYWTYNLYCQSIASELAVKYFVLGLTVYLLLITIFYIQFRRRVFDR